MASGEFPRLTARQQAVLQLLCSGSSNKEIAANLHISVKTVEFHVASLFRKFASMSRVEVAMSAVRDEHSQRQM